MIQFHKALPPYKYQGVFYATTSAKLPELPKYGQRLFLHTSIIEFFMPTTQKLQCYQVTSHRHQEGPYQTDDAKLQTEGGGG